MVRSSALAFRHVAAALTLVAGMAAGQGAIAASVPLATDILPSGVPLPVPAPVFVPPPQDASTQLLGNAGGVRPWLAARGVQVTIQDVEELWGLLAGGARPGPTYDGMTAVALSVDSKAAFGWEGGLFNISALQIRGRSFTGERLGALNPVSGYDAGRSTRLFELWYGQSFLHNQLDVRVGSIDLDTEFLVSQNASFFLNASFGWPLSTSSNLYSGGPSWPYSAVGGRVKWTPVAPVVLMGAITDDNPTRGPFYSAIDPAQRDPSGTTFSTSGGTLFIGEVQLWLDAARRLAGKDAPALPGTWKLGALYDTGRFPDQRFDSQGGLLASPASNGTPFYHRGNWLAYAVLDQTVWRRKKDSGKTINFFTRATVNDGTRNLVAVEVQSGFTFDELLPGRPDDTIGIAWGAGFYGRRALQHARDALRLGTSATGMLRPEHHVELTYQAAVTPWLIVQPDFQYFLHVGGVSGTSDNGRSLRHAVVSGLNVTTTF
ncbi:MAG: carbohydrate porin [Acetobacter sp.]